MSINKNVAFWVCIGVLLLSVAVFYIPRKLEIDGLKAEYPVVLDDLKRAYENYVLQKMNFEKLKESFVNVETIDEFIKKLPSDLKVRVENNALKVNGSMESGNVGKFVSTVLRVSNFTFGNLKIVNEFSLPFVVFPLKEQLKLDLNAEIVQLEVIR